MVPHSDIPLSSWQLSWFSSCAQYLNDNDDNDEYGEDDYVVWQANNYADSNWKLCKTLDDFDNNNLWGKSYWPTKLLWNWMLVNTNKKPQYFLSRPLLETSPRWRPSCPPRHCSPHHPPPPPPPPRPARGSPQVATRPPPPRVPMSPQAPRPDWRLPSTPSPYQTSPAIQVLILWRI